MRTLHKNVPATKTLRRRRRDHSLVISVRPRRRRRPSAKRYENRSEWARIDEMHNQFVV